MIRPSRRSARVPNLEENNTVSLRSYGWAMTYVSPVPLSGFCQGENGDVSPMKGPTKIDGHADMSTATPYCVLFIFGGYVR